MWPSIAASRAERTAPLKVSMSFSGMTWSAATIITSALGSRRSAMSMPAATAGAVSRRSGSSTMVALRPICSVCSRTKKRNASWVITIGGSNSSGSDTRARACWKVERSPTSGRNCLGMPSRETGHSRVPEPPARMRGTMRGMAWDGNTVCIPNCWRGGEVDPGAGRRNGQDRIYGHRPAARSPFYPPVTIKGVFVARYGKFCRFESRLPR